MANACWSTPPRANLPVAPTDASPCRCRGRGCAGGLQRATSTDPKVEDEWLQHPAGLCGMPEDVRKLVEDYDTCEHFAGEEPYDADRRHEIEVAVAQFCTPAPARLATLMQRYRNDAHVSQWLRQYAKQADLQPAG
ncbi:hypothetical protein [Xanthomonas citri]|uniref:hypothetical protein n=1 Tax=Xanthomonas citri TaxID=346 RepID=UPI003CC836BC